VRDAERTLSAPENISFKKSIAPKDADDAFGLVRGAVVIAYPEGLPSHDPVMEALDDNEELEGQAAKEVLSVEQAVLWWAGKQLDNAKTLGDYVGRNEKSKVVVKVAKKGSGPPVRESAVDEKTQREMMAYYYKKQEEQKKMLEEAEDETPTRDAPWADPSALKKAFTGVNNLRI
jgi:hypothetical protein